MLKDPGIYSFLEVDVQENYAKLFVGTLVFRLGPNPQGDLLGPLLYSEQSAAETAFSDNEFVSCVSCMLILHAFAELF